MKNLNLLLASMILLCTFVSFSQKKIVDKPEPIMSVKGGESLFAAEDAGKIPVQGRLTDGGAPANGTFEFVFTISIDSATNWTETHPVVQVTNGFYSVVLGSITPIPEFLFQEEDSREVEISIDGTALTPITIYSPFGTNVGRFLVQNTQDSISTALSAFNITEGTTGTLGTRRAIYAEARGPGNNVGVFSYAENGRSINNQSELTDPNIYITGQLASLYGASDVGGRALQGQYTATGPGHGIGLSGFAGGEGMNWGVWGRANALGDSMQVGGYMEAFGPGTGDQYGVWGQATGENSSRNIGVYGTAFNSPGENWAAWFDGQVSVQDGSVQYFESGGDSFSSMGSRSLIFRGEDGEANSYLGNNWLNGGAQTNNRGALVLWGDTTTRDALGGVDIRRAALTVADDGFGKDVGRLELMAPVTGDNLLVELGINSDSTTFKGSLILKGSDGSFFEITSDGIPGGTGPQSFYALTDSISEWKTFDIGFGPSSQLNFSGGFDGTDLLSGGASIGNKGWEEINPRNGYVHVNDSSGSNAVRVEAVTDSVSTFGYVELNGLDGRRMEARPNAINLFNSTGDLKADFNIFDQNNAGSLVLYGNNNNRNIILGATGQTGGETGFMGMYDTNDQVKLSLRIDTVEGGGQDYGKILMFNSDYSRAIELNADQSLLKAQDIELIADNDSLSIAIGSRPEDFAGAMYLYDSLGENKAQIVGRNNGGYLQLDQKDPSGNFQSAIVAAASNSNSFLSMYGQNPTQDGITFMIDQYITNNEIDFGPPMPGNYRRSGTDWKDNEGTLLAAIGTARDPNNGDPTGKSGYLTMWGTNSLNFALQGKRFEEDNLPLFEMFGIRDTNVRMEVAAGPGTENFSTFALTSNDSTTGYFNENVFMSSDIFGGNFGGIEVRDSLGNASVGVYGDGSVFSTDGTFSILRSSDSQSAINMFQNAGNGGLSIQDAGNQGRLFFEAGSGNLVLRYGGCVEHVSID